MKTKPTKRVGQKGRSVTLKLKSNITTAVIQNSSKFLKHRDNSFRRANPCEDDETFNILSESLRTHTVPFRQLFRYATFVDYLLMALGTICSFAAAIFNVLTIHYLGMFYEFYNKWGSNPCFKNLDGTISHVPCPYLWFCIVLIILVFFDNFFFEIAAKRQSHRLHVAYVEAIARKDSTWFHSYIDRDLPFRVRKDMQQIRVGIGESLGKLVFHTTTGLLMLMTTFTLGRRIFLLSGILVPAFTITSLLKVRSDAKLKIKENQFYKPANKVAAQSLTKIKLVKMFCGESKAVRSYVAAMFSPWDLRKPIILTAIWAGLCWLIPMLIHPFLMWLTLEFLEKIDETSSKYHGGNLTKEEQCMIYPTIWERPLVPLFGRLDTVLMYITFAVYFFSEIPLIYGRVNKAKFIAAEVFFYIDWRPGIQSISGEGHIPRQTVIGKFVIINGTFSYPVRPRIQVLRGISISAHPGQMVSIFGPSKCGKTTILRLLLRKYDFCSGTIQLDGTDLFTLNVPWLRSQIGYVSQYPVLLNGTVEENLRGPLNVSIQEITAACKKAKVFSDIMALDKGFNCVVGSRSNVKLTLLQIKKLCLARVLLRKCRVILLDDFFSQMDVRTEAAMVELFESIRDTNTLIVSSGKINALMKSCDVIYVMKEGEIVQFGNHENISKTEGFYMDLLQETLKEGTNITGTRPKTDSQLLYYKFANAIRRIHDIHDVANNLDYEKMFDNKRAIQSILLRHNIGNQERLVPSRIVGGYYKFVNFETSTDSNYERTLLRNELVHSRDLRAKILPDPEFDGYPGIQGHLRRKALSERAAYTRPKRSVPGQPRPSLLLVSSKYSIARKNVTKNAPSKKHKAKDNISIDSNKISNDSTGSEALGAENVIDMMIVDSKRKIDMEPERNTGNLEKFTGKTRQSSFKGLAYASAQKRRVSIWNTAGVQRLQHYFGWPLNAPVDTTSISSEDSFRFWDDYSSRLQLSSKGAREPVTAIQLLKLAKYCWPYLILCFATSVNMGISLVLSVDHTTDVLITYVNQNNNEGILEDLPHVVYFAILASLGAFVQELVLGFGICKLNNKFRISQFTTVLEQDLRWFERTRNDIQYLCDYLASDIATVNTILIAMVTIYTESTVIILSLLVFMLWESQSLWLESLSLFLIIPFLITINYLQGITNRVKMWQEPSKSESVLYDMMCNIHEVIAQGLSAHMLGQYKAAEFGTSKKKTFAKRLKDVWEIAMKSLIFAFSMASFLLSFSIWSILVINQIITSHFSIHGNLNSTSVFFTSVTYLMLYGFFPMGFALAGVPGFWELSDSASFIFETEAALQRKTSYRRNQISFVLEAVMPPPSITFENVSCADAIFEDVLVLEEVSFVVPSGHYVAVVGPISSSKIALVGLLMRLLTPEAGQIYINDISYDDLDDRSIRKLIAIVTQDPDLFADLSISENIAYGDNSRKVSQPEIVEACKMALIHDIIQTFPEKYWTKLKDLPVEPGTFALRQRIAVARAAVRNPKVVLIDEMTVSVDDQSDRLLMKALMNLRQGRTFVVISQRIHPIRRANTILVLNEGTVIESGTDKELLQRKGLYYEMYMSQQLYERDSDQSAIISMSYFNSVNSSFEP